MCDSQAKQLLVQAEEVGSSKHRLSLKDQEYEGKIEAIEKDAERRIYETEKALRAEV